MVGTCGLINTKYICKQIQSMISIYIIYTQCYCSDYNILQEIILVFILSKSIPCNFERLVLKINLKILFNIQVQFFCYML